MTLVTGEQRFYTHDKEAMGRWWDLVRTIARSSLMTEKGTRIYVTETLEQLRDAPVGRFVEVHVVSAATGSMYEVDRVVNDPALRRLIPLAKVANVAPIVDELEL